MGTSTSQKSFNRLNGKQTYKPFENRNATVKSQAPTCLTTQSLERAGPGDDYKYSPESVANSTLVGVKSTKVKGSSIMTHMKQSIEDIKVRHANNKTTTYPNFMQ